MSHRLFISGAWPLNVLVSQIRKQINWHKLIQIQHKHAKKNCLLRKRMYSHWACNHSLLKRKNELRREGWGRGGRGGHSASYSDYPLFVSQLSLLFCTSQELDPGNWSFKPSICGTICGPHSVSGGHAKSAENRGVARRGNQITADALPVTNALKCEFIANGGRKQRSWRVKGNVALLTARFEHRGPTWAALVKACPRGCKYASFRENQSTHRQDRTGTGRKTPQFALKAVYFIQKINLAPFPVSAQ